jgi:DNA-binding NarL/FixJ family response regulator
MPESFISVLCVDDHCLVREGLALIINREPDMRMVASASNGRDAIALFSESNPDITLMDLRLGKMDGIAVIKAIRQIRSDARIIVVTMYEGDEDVHRALLAGATTYVLKDSLGDDLIQVIRKVHAGERPMRADVTALMKDWASHPALTAREVEVLGLVADGRRNKQIATLLQISEETVIVHIRNIFQKLDVTERTSAVNVALRRGIVHLY